MHQTSTSRLEKAVVFRAGQRQRIFALRLRGHSEDFHYLGFSVRVHRVRNRAYANGSTCLARALLLLALASVLPGCGNLNTIYRPITIGSGTGALIGIKQRAILAAPVTSHKGSGTEQDVSIVVCAEPSPDALSAYATTLTGSNQTVEASAAFQESSAFVGLRTSSVQLLRDAMYRICEARMNGALTNEGYALLLRRYQKEIVALLAIEQLTGALRASIVAVDAIDNTDKSSDKKSKNADGDNKRLPQLNQTKKQGDAKAVGTPIPEPNATHFDNSVELVSKTVEDIANKILDVDDVDAFCFAEEQKPTDICASYEKALKAQYDAISNLYKKVANATGRGEVSDIASLVKQIAALEEQGIKMNDITVMKDRKHVSD